MVRAFVIKGTNDLASVDTDLEGGAGDDLIQYNVNAPLSIDGGIGIDTIIVIGTEMDDNFIITEDGVWGAGLSVDFVGVEMLEVDALEGDDHFFILSTNPALITIIIGGLGSDTFDIGGDITEEVVTGQGGAYNIVQSHLTNEIKGPLIIEGSLIPGRDRSLKPAVILYTETDGPLPVLEIIVDETEKTDILNIFNDASVLNTTGTHEHPVFGHGLAKVYDIDASLIEITEFGNISGLGMGTGLSFDFGEPGNPEIYPFDGGVTYHGVEVVDIMLGQGNDTFTNETTIEGVITLIQGGGGSDTITVTGCGGTLSPLVVFGDTSQDGRFYDSTTVDITGNARSFLNNHGNDVIDASAIAQSITIYGGAGDDTIYGSQAADHIAGGSGNDTIYGQVGADHIYGDSGFNIDLSLRISLALEDLDHNVLTVATAPGIDDYTDTSDDLAAGQDTLYGEAGDDFILGDHGVIEQVYGTERILTTRYVIRMETVEENNGFRDIITGDDGNDRIFAGSGSDLVNFGLDANQDPQPLSGEAGDDLIVGDNGFAEFIVLPDTSSRPIRIETEMPQFGGDDYIYTGEGAKILFGGVGNDTLEAGGDAFADVVVGDEGFAEFNPDNGNVSRIGTQTPQSGGQDIITAGNGPNILVGGSDSDYIQAGNAPSVDIVIGDNGLAVFDSTGTFSILREIQTSDAGYGDDDEIFTGEGPDVVMGGDGSDSIQSGFDTSRDVVLGDNGIALFNPDEVLVEIRSTDPYIGGDDDILVGDGDDVVIGGIGSDYINIDRLTGLPMGTDSGIDVIIGDNGEAFFDPINGRSLLRIIQTIYAVHGGDDFIFADNGFDTVFGGSGADLILAGYDGSRDVVLGDNGIAIFDPSEILIEIRSTDPSIGGDDDILVGDGDDVVIGGIGSDYINMDRLTGLPMGTDSGVDIIIGDNGEAFFDPINGRSLLRTIQTTYAVHGGDDFIFADNGFDTVFGGSGADLILAGGDDAETDVVLGDNGSAFFSPTGILLEIQTIVPEFGGADVITTGDGRDIVLGGSDNDIILAAANDAAAASFLYLLGTDYIVTPELVADIIATGAGDDSADIILGDNGHALFVNEVLTSVYTTDPEYGGDDIINSGNGPDIVFGGSANDVILAGGDDAVTDVVLGDSGSAIFTPDGALEEAWTNAAQFGGVDIITTGDGVDIVLGGSNNDIILAAADDTAAGSLLDLLEDEYIITPELVADMIATGAGDDSADIILGDNGHALFVNEVLISINSTDPEYGGDDIINSGNGPDIVFGGSANDVILAGGDDAVTDVVLGDSGSAFFSSTGVILEIQTIAPEFGGVDIITTGDGRDIVLGGNNNDIILAAANDSTASSFLYLLGTNHIITPELVADMIATGAGDDSADIILGDNGHALFVNEVLTSIYTTDPEYGGDDIINSGNGPDVVFGGSANDVILAGGDDAVTDVVLGDSGSASFSPTGVLIEIQTIAPEFGSVDVITTGDGRDIVLGGSNNDIILAAANDSAAASFLYLLGTNYIITPELVADMIATGAGDGSADIILGDNGHALFVNEVLTNIYSTDPEYGGDDIINSGNGPDIVFGGSANDVVLAGGDDAVTDIVLGDSGSAIFTQTGILIEIKTTAPELGGLDIITTGDGSDIVLGGSEADIVLAAGNDAASIAILNLIGENYTITPELIILVNEIGAGDSSIDIIIGDNGICTYLEGVLVEIKTSDPTLGGNDILNAGNGPDVIFGGSADDVIFAAGNDNAEDIILGDNARATFEGTESFEPGEEYSTISFNFNGYYWNTGITGIAGASGAEADNWNNLDGGGLSIFGNEVDETVVFDDGSRAVDVMIEWGADLDDQYPSWTGTDTHSQLYTDEDQNMRLFEGYLYTYTQDTIGTVISGLAGYYRSYDVYVYLDADNYHSSNNNSVRRISDGTTTYYLNDPDNVHFDGTYIQALSTDPLNPDVGNYVVFSGLTSDTFSITVDDDEILLDSYYNHPTISAIQIVGHHHPIDRIETIDPEYGGDDQIFSGGGADLVFGGTGDDYIESYGQAI
ncbi:MAG: hypothetical protein GY869_02075, partial [Planctomycetes bacterium]|nr:hypothetical protein [Planctomycetota bacterium]